LEGEPIAVTGPAQIDVLALHEALEKLAQLDPRQSEVVELHHFGGHTLEETAKLLDISLSTAKAEWTVAKAWLHRELSQGDSTT
jgi:RNA polymerase sigma factor (sigma-70 family)